MTDEKFGFNVKSNNITEIANAIKEGLIKAMLVQNYVNVYVWYFYTKDTLDREIRKRVNSIDSRTLEKISRINESLGGYFNTRCALKPHIISKKRDESNTRTLCEEKKQSVDEIEYVYICGSYVKDCKRTDLLYHELYKTNDKK
jgi:hypothetical protein